MPEIETAALGNEAGMIGAASLLYVKYGGDNMRINPDNKKIRYSGRIDWRNPKEPIWVYPCTSAEFKFTGKYLKIFLKNKMISSHLNYLKTSSDSNVRSFYLLIPPNSGELKFISFTKQFRFSIGFLLLMRQ